MQLLVGALEGPNGSVTGNAGSADKISQQHLDYPERNCTSF